MQLLYFAYGSNMLTKRIIQNAPSANFVDIGELEKYKLEFYFYTDKWKGCYSTITYDCNSSIYGIIWSIDDTDIKSLDQEELVDQNVYTKIPVIIKSFSDDPRTSRVYSCFSYILTDYIRYIPCNNQPSVTYLTTIVNGAIEHKLPNQYIETLKKIKNNKMFDYNLYKSVGN